MKFMLDTNICIYIIKQKPRKVFELFNEYKVGDIGVSSVTLAELQFGVSKSLYPEKNRHALEEFILPLEVAAFDEKAADVYGDIRAFLERQGTPIGSMDTFIGAHALSMNVTLVTNNVREFQRIRNLSIADWTA